MQLEVLNSGIIYKNISPGFKSESAYLPNLVSLSEKEILCFIRIGSAFYSPDGKIFQFRSIDSGKTWIQETPINLVNQMSIITTPLPIVLLHQMEN